MSLGREVPPDVLEEIPVTMKEVGKTKKRIVACGPRFPGQRSGARLTSWFGLKDLSISISLLIYSEDPNGTRDERTSKNPDKDMFCP